MNKLPIGSQIDIVECFIIVENSVWIQSQHLHRDVIRDYIRLITHEIHNQESY